MRAAVIALTLVAALPGPIAALASAAPVPGAPLLVIVPPWRDALAVIDRAGGRATGPVAAPIAALAILDTADAVARLRAAGALLVRDGTALLELCGGAT